MNKLLNNIKNANQILLFLAAILFIGMISKDFFRDLFREKYKPEKIQIADNTKPNERNTAPSYTVDFEKKIKDVYMFKIRSNFINNSVEHEKIYAYKISADRNSSSTYRSYIGESVVNLMFINADGQKRILLEKDALIVNFSEAIVDENKIFPNHEKNIYLITTSDSNKDGFLDQNDQRDLYVSAYNGSDLKLILQDVGSYDVIEDNLLFIQQSGNNGKFFTYKITESLLAELNTEIPIKSK